MQESEGEAQRLRERCQMLEREVSTLRCAQLPAQISFSMARTARRGRAGA